MAKCAIQFPLFVAIFVANLFIANSIRSGPGSQQDLVNACSKVLATDTHLIEFCSKNFLVGREREFTNLNDGRRMTRAAMSRGVTKSVALQKTVANMLNNKSLPPFERVMVNLCLESVTKGAEQMRNAAAGLDMVGKELSNEELMALERKLDEGKFNQGKCDELLQGQQGLAALKEQVHATYLGSLVVSKFLINVRA